MNEKPLIDATSEKVLSLAAETQFAPNGIVSRTLLRTVNSRAVLFGFSEDQELTEHTSTQHALIQILSGECEFSLSGQPRQLKTGDLLYMPPHLPHSVRATQQFSMLLALFRPSDSQVSERVATAVSRRGIVEGQGFVGEGFQATQRSTRTDPALEVGEASPATER